jgi:hypothetical protein
MADAQGQVLDKRLFSAKIEHDLEVISDHVRNCIPAWVSRGAPSVGSQ